MTIETVPNTAVGERYGEMLDAWYDQQIQANAFRGSAGWNSPSSIGHPCLRFHVLRRTKGEFQKPFSKAQLERMEMGKEIGRIAQLRLISAGFEVMRMEEQIEYRVLMMRGKADNIARPPMETGPFHIWEFKSVAPRIFDSITDYRSVIDNRFPWIRFAPYQCVSYLILERHKRSRAKVDLDSATLWYWSLDGRRKRVEVPYGQDMVDEITDRCERVNAHIGAGTEPEPICDPDICPGCSFFQTEACDIRLAMAADTQVVTDESDIDVVRRYLVLKPQAREYTAVRNRLNLRFGGVESALVPGVGIVRGKQMTRHMKPQVERTDRWWNVEVVSLQPEEGET